LADAAGQEHDDDPSYDDLPACGRLAHSYPLAFDKPLVARYVRFLCTPLEDKGMGISELQIFDRVEVSPWPTDIQLLEHTPMDAQVH
jgi:hypothetical protein